jgi:hypothetical protein
MRSVVNMSSLAACEEWQDWHCSPIVVRWTVLFGPMPVPRPGFLGKVETPAFALLHQKAMIDI